MFSLSLGFFFTEDRTGVVVEREREGVKKNIEVDGWLDICVFTLVFVVWLLFYVQMGFLRSS